MSRSVLVSVVLFFALLLGLRVGRRVGQRMKVGKDDVGTGAAEGVIFAVFGLIVAFTFSASAARFSERKKLIVDQANALGTANLRLDALDAADRTVIRQKLLQWVEMAQDLSATAGDAAGRKAALDRAAGLQQEVWNLAAGAVERKAQPALWGFVMSPINDWTDLSSTRQAEDSLGAPPMVMPTLVVLSLVASLLAGFQMSRYEKQSVLHRVAFAGILSFLMLVIFDLNHPRSGLMRVSSVDQSMGEVGDSLKAALAAK